MTDRYPHLTFKWRFNHDWPTALIIDDRNVLKADLTTNPSSLFGLLVKLNEIADTTTRSSLAPLRVMTRINEH